MTETKKPWTSLCIYLYNELGWSPREVMQLAVERKQLVKKWTERNENIKMVKRAELEYSPGFYSFVKEK